MTGAMDVVVWLSCNHIKVARVYSLSADGQNSIRKVRGDFLNSFSNVVHVVLLPV